MATPYICGFCICVSLYVEGLWTCSTSKMYKEDATQETVIYSVKPFFITLECEPAQLRCDKHMPLLSFHNKNINRTSHMGLFSSNSDINLIKKCISKCIASLKHQFCSVKFHIIYICFLLHKTKYNINMFLRSSVFPHTPQTWLICIHFLSLKYNAALNGVFSILFIMVFINHSKFFFLRSSQACQKWVLKHSCWKLLLFHGQSS